MQLFTEGRYPVVIVQHDAVDEAVADRLLQLAQPAQILLAHGGRRLDLDADDPAAPVPR